jgi:oxygen-independent coproporphyrinogen-3 oxidase
MSSTLGLYIHLPFCQSKCHYCDFASGVYPRELEVPYLRALRQEILSLERISAQVGISSEQLTCSLVDTIYLGGGTPSFIAGEHIMGLMRQLRQVLRIAPNPEVTIEVNPGSADSRKIDSYLEAGINRISIGMQTFQNQLLSQIGRSHCAEDALNTFQLFRERGLSNISVDIMAGLPGQTREHWKKNLQTVQFLDPDHVSMYLLEIHENTQFGKIYGGAISGGFQRNESRLTAELPSEDLIEWFYLESIQDLDSSGYRQYEISNFAKPGFESRHNLKYWLGRPYLGLGCSAHSCVDGKRWANERSVGRYVELIQNQSHAVDVQAVQTSHECLEETIFLSLRLTQGLDLAAFKKNFGFEFTEHYRKQLECLQESQLIKLSSDRLWLTPKGNLLSNEVFTELLR